MSYVSNLRTEWFGNIRGDLLAGMVVALALIPEAIAFSIIAGVDPKVGLYASFCIAVVIAFVGGRPGMISAATGAMALVMVSLVKNYGLEYLLAATILTGILQILAGVFKLGVLLRFVSRSVMTGFVNALAILIFMAQLPEFYGASWMVYAMVAVGLAIIYLFPYVTKAIPSPLVCIVALTGFSIFMKLDIRTVGDMGELPSTLAHLPAARHPAELGDAAHHPALLGHAGRGRPVGIADDGRHRRRSDRHPQRQESGVYGPGNRQHRGRLLWRHGRLCHDWAIGHQRQVRRTWATLHPLCRQLPALPDPGVGRSGAADSHGGVGCGDDHGLHRYL